MKKCTVIGVKIKKLRELRNFTQEYMAEQLQMSQAGYSKIERDVVDISCSRLAQIAAILGMDAAAVIAFDEADFLNKQQPLAEGYLKVHPVPLTTISCRERELYEENIRLLKEKISFLENKR